MVQLQHTTPDSHINWITFLKPLRLKKIWIPTFIPAYWSKIKGNLVTDHAVSVTLSVIYFCGQQNAANT